MAPQPSSPTYNFQAVDVTYEQNTTPTALMVTSSDAGATFRWYTAAVGGTGFTSITPSTSTRGVTTYYVSEVLNGAESARQPLTVTITPDVTAPTIISDVATPGSGSFGVGQLISFRLNTSEPVAVAGTPTLTLNDGGTASFVAAASNSTSLMFQTTVASGHNAAALAVTGVDLSSGATIKDLAGNNAVLTGAIATFPAISVDTIKPIVQISSSSAANGAATTSSTLAYTVNFSENVSGFSSNDLLVGNGSINSFSALSASTYAFTISPTYSSVPTTVTVFADGAQDAAGNTNIASNTYMITYIQRVTAQPIVLSPLNGMAIKADQPTITGTAVANSVVTVYLDNALIGTTTATDTGTFSLAAPFALSQGSHMVRATAQAPGQAISPNSNIDIFTVDTIAPTVTISSAAGVNGGTTATPSIVYTVNFSEAVTGFTAGSVTVTNGSITSFFGSGSVYNITVTPTIAGTPTTLSVPSNDVRDTAGNFNIASSPYSLTYQPPITVPPVVTSPINGSLTNDDHPTIAGIAAPNSLVTVLIDGQSVGTTTANSSGNFTFPAPNALSQGSHSVTATAQATGFAVSQPSNSDTFTVDTIAPAAPVLLTPTIAVSTNATLATVAGTAEAGSSVKIYFDANSNGVVDAGDTLVGTQQLGLSSDTFTFGALLTSNAQNRFIVTATDLAGNVSQPTIVPTITGDSIAPAAPTIVGPTSSIVTNVRTPVVTGTAEAGALVTLYDTDGTSVLGRAIATGGAFTIASNTLSEGSHNLTVKATDLAGNVGAASSVTTIVVDTTNPAVTIAAPGSTNSLTQTISGTVTDDHAVGTTVTLSEGGTTLGTAVVQADRTWSKAISLSSYGSHTITATDVDLAGNSGQAQVSFTVFEPAAPVDPTAAAPINLSPGQSQTLSGLTSGSLSLSGGGTLTLTGTNTYSGPTTVNAGTLLVDGSIVSPTDVKSGGTLGGHGITGTVTVEAGGTLSPGNSPGVLTTRDLTLAAGAALKEEFGGTAQGQFDQTKVIGSVSLSGASLNLASYNGFVSAYGDRFTIIDNDGTDAVQGRFAGLSEGASLKLGSHSYLISYRGGDGNDVVLTDVTLPSAATLAPFGTVETNPGSQTGSVYALYQGLLGRAPDALGLEGFSASLQAGAKLTDVASAILGSAEHGPAVSDPSAYVQSLYANALHRTADSAGLSYFTGELNAGVSQATVAVQIASSTEAQQANAPAFGAGVFVADAIDAGVARLYYGVLGRAPDAAGLQAFEMQVKQLAATGGVNGAAQGLANVANAMLGSSEYAQTHAGQTNAAFVDSLFVGALGRHADAGGAAFFSNELAHGASQAQVAMQIAQSPEAQVHLVSQIEMGWHLV